MMLIYKILLVACTFALSQQIKDDLEPRTSDFIRLSEQVEEDIDSNIAVLRALYEDKEKPLEVAAGKAARKLLKMHELYEKVLQCGLNEPLHRWSPTQSSKVDRIEIETQLKELVPSICVYVSSRNEFGWSLRGFAGALLGKVYNSGLAKLEEAFSVKQEKMSTKMKDSIERLIPDGIFEKLLGDRGVKSPLPMNFPISQVIRVLKDALIRGKDYPYGLPDLNRDRKILQKLYDKYVRKPCSEYIKFWGNLFEPVEKLESYYGRCTLFLKRKEEFKQQYLRFQVCRQLLTDEVKQNLYDICKRRWGFWKTEKAIR